MYTLPKQLIMQKNYILLVTFLLTSIAIQATDARLDSMVLYEIVEGGTEFQKAGKLSFMYNAKNLIISEEFDGQQLDISETEEDHFMLDYLYDSQDRIELITTSIFENKVKNPMMKESRTYNNENLLLQAQQSFYDEDTEEWATYFIVDYIYENGLLKSETTSVPLPLPIGNLVQSQIEYEYDALDRAIEEKEYTVNFFTQELEKSTRTKNIYDGDKLRSVVYYNVVNNAWIEESKEDYAYDGNENPNEIVDSNWNATTSTWIAFEKTVNTFDNSFSNLNFILPLFINDGIGLDDILVNPVNKSEEFTKVGEFYVSTDYTDFYWDIDGTSQLTTTAASEFSVYPNPNTGTFNLSTQTHSKISVINLAGQEIYHASFPAGTHQITLQNAQNGMYILRITHDNSVKSQKFMVK